IAGIGCGLLAVGSLLAPFVGAWLQAPTQATADFVGAFRLSLVASVTLLVCSVVSAISRGMQEPGVTTASSVLGVLVGFVASFVLLLAGWGVWALATGLVVRSAIVVAGSMLYLACLPGRLS